MVFFSIALKSSHTLFKNSHNFVLWTEKFMLSWCCINQCNPKVIFSHDSWNRNKQTGSWYQIKLKRTRIFILIHLNSLLNHFFIVDGFKISTKITWKNSCLLGFQTYLSNKIFCSCYFFQNDRPNNMWLLGFQEVGCIQLPAGNLTIGQ